MWRPTDALHLRDRRQPSMIMPARAQPCTSASVHIFSTLTDNGAEVPLTPQARVDVCAQRRAPGQLSGRLGRAEHRGNYVFLSYSLWTIRLVCASQSCPGRSFWAFLVSRSDTGERRSFSLIYATEWNQQIGKICTAVSPWWFRVLCIPTSEKGQ